MSQELTVVVQPWAGVQCCVRKWSEQAMEYRAVRGVPPWLFCSCLQIPALLFFFQ